jgi:hypothetical protein
MPVRPPRRAALVPVLVALSLSLAGCDGSAAPSATPSAADSHAGACPLDRVEMSGIDGRVVDTDGNPLGDVLVLFDSGTGFTGDARTAEDGVFSAPGVTGEFTLSTVDIDHLPLTQRVTVPCGETVEVELVLTPAEE